MNKKITFTLTACGRPDLLEMTLDSFFKINTYPIARYKIVDDSTIEGINDGLIEKYKKYNIEWTHNKTKLGQTMSIDNMYDDIDTEYIFHCEDDWEFIKEGFIEKSLTILEKYSKIVLVNIRQDVNGHPVEKYNEELKVMCYDYYGIWNGFTWNPSLRRLSDYLLVKPYSSLGWETECSLKYKELGFRAAILEDKYIEHIGAGRHISDAVHG